MYSIPFYRSKTVPLRKVKKYVIYKYTCDKKLSKNESFTSSFLNADDSFLVS